MSKDIGFGIVGAGLIAPFHLKAIRDAEGGKAVAIFDIDGAKAQKVADEYGLRAYTSLDEFLKDPELDVVCVATPNHLHRDIVIKSAEAGKHVLTEKPPAMSLKETDEMIEACKKAGVKFGCFVQIRTRTAIQAMKKAIEDGRFGKLLRVDAYMKWYRPQEYYTSDGWRGQQKSGSGVTVAQGFHYVDLMQYLAGPAVKVDCRMDNIGHPGIALEDDTVANIEFANGVKGLAQLSTAVWPGLDIRIEVSGTDGLAVSAGEKMLKWEFKDKKPEDEEIQKIGNEAQATGAGGAASFGYLEHKTVVQDMINVIGTDKDVVIPVTDVRPTLEIILGMYQSAKKGAPIEWPVCDDESVWE